MYIVNSSESLRKKYAKSRMVEFEIPRPLPKEEPKPKEPPKPKREEPKPVKEKEAPLPVSNIREKPAEETPVDAKPVFGVTADTVKGADSTTGIGIRVGNTLMKEQEKEYTQARSLSRKKR